MRGRGEPPTSRNSPADASRRRRSTAGAPHDPPRHLMPLEPLSLGTPRAGRARAQGCPGVLGFWVPWETRSLLRGSPSGYSTSSLRATAQGSSANRPNGKPTAGCAARRRRGRRLTRRATRAPAQRARGGRAPDRRNGHVASIAFGLPSADAFVRRGNGQAIPPRERGS